MSKSVERTLDLLELFGTEKRQLSLSDIAHLLKIPVSSCYDVVQAMHARGYLYQIAPRAGYYPTLRFNKVSQEIAKNDPILARTEILLRSLRDVLDESVLLSKIDKLAAVYLLVFDAVHPLRIQINVGDHIRSLYATSAGKALLGHLDDGALTAFLRSAKLMPLTSQTITYAPALRENIELSKKRGWYLNQEESLDGVTTVSATFRWNLSVFIVTVAGPSSRIEQKLDTIVKLLTSTCHRLQTQSVAA